MGFSCLRFLSRLFRAGLGIVPFRRTLRHLRPYTFKQASRPVILIRDRRWTTANPRLWLRALPLADSLQCTARSFPPHAARAPSGRTTRPARTEGPYAREWH